jgi:hypothetical protein
MDQGAADTAPDSGASDVSIPSDVFLTLIRTGTINKEDIFGKEKYKLADGTAAAFTNVSDSTFESR